MPSLISEVCVLSFDYKCAWSDHFQEEIKHLRGSIRADMVPMGRKWMMGVSFPVSDIMSNDLMEM
jgi:hypothetical protein